MKEESLKALGVTHSFVLEDRVETVRTTLPHVAAVATQLVVDNPVQFGLVAAGSLVLARAAVNIVKPRTPLEFLALLCVLEFASPLLIRKAMDTGLLKFRIRDESGQLVPLAVSS